MSTLKEKESYNQLIGSYNFCPKFNQKFSLKISELNQTKQEKQKQNTYDDMPIKFVVYKFDSNYLNQQSEMANTKNFKILDDLRQHLLER